MGLTVPLEGEQFFSNIIVYRSHTTKADISTKNEWPALWEMTKQSEARLYVSIHPGERSPSRVLPKSARFNVRIFVSWCFRFRSVGRSTGRKCPEVRAISSWFEVWEHIIFLNITL